MKRSFKQRPLFFAGGGISGGIVKGVPHAVVPVRGAAVLKVHMFQRPHRFLILAQIIVGNSQILGQGVGLRQIENGLDRFFVRSGPIPLINLFRQSHNMSCLLSYSIDHYVFFSGVYGSMIFKTLIAEAMGYRIYLRVDYHCYCTR